MTGRLLYSVVEMELSDEFLLVNRDWDPNYLKELMDTEFHDFTEMWHSNVEDFELVNETEKVERYCPVTEDISIDDETLSKALDDVEYQ